MFSWWSKTIYYDVRHDCDEWKGDSIFSMCLDMQLHSSTSKIWCWYSHHRILVVHCRNVLSEYSSGSKYPCWHLNVSAKKNIHSIYINYIQRSYFLWSNFPLHYCTYTCTCVCTIGNIHFQISSWYTFYICACENIYSFIHVCMCVYF